MKHLISSIILIVLSCISVRAQQVTIVAPQKEDAVQIVVHEGFTAQYNSSTLQPDWVSWELTPEEVVRDGGVSRSDEFLPDPLVKGRTATSRSYSRTGYDRGHMAPAADFRYDQNIQDESFYMSNICLQDHDLNEKAWLSLESQCRFWCHDYYKTTLWIAAGPLFEDEPQCVGSDSMPVPSAFWKVVCRKWDGGYDAVGFVFPNRPCGTDWKAFAVSVDDVEKATGLDFFPFIQDSLEEKAESAFNLKYWK